MPQDPFERVQVFLSETRANPFALLLDLTTLLPENLIWRAIELAEHADEDALRAFLIHALGKRLSANYQRIELAKTYPIPKGRQIEEVSIPEGKEAKRLIEKLSEQERYKVFDQILGEAEIQARAGSSACASSGAADEKVTGRSPDEKYRSGERRRRSGGDVASKGVKSVEDEGGFEAFEPPVSTGGGGGLGFSGDPADIGSDEGFEFTGGGAQGDEPGGSAASDAGYESAGGEPDAPAPDDDDGFESVTVPAPPPEPQPTLTGAEYASKGPDFVNLGFAPQPAADKRLRDEPLQRGHSYYFWIRIGKDKDEAAIGTPEKIDLEEFKKVFEEPVLTVAIFGFENELAITPGHDVGELKIQKDGKVKVLRQPLDKNSISLSAAAPADYLHDYLLFPINVPNKEATYRLRCNIYCAQVLVQSYVVSAHVKSTPEPVKEPCSQILDYVLSDSLQASHLASMTKEPHLLSLMVNANGDGSHSFRFFGDDGTERFKDDSQIDGQEISGFLSEARQAMHRVSWGNVNAWDPDTPIPYRYQSGTFDRKKLARDLAFLARAGWSIFYGFAQHLKTTIEDLQKLMANPGSVQIALKLSPRVVVPAAIIYDYNWEPDNFVDFSTTEFELCPTFSAAIDQARDGGPPLEECDCFKGKCALKAMIEELTNDQDRSLLDLPPIICPSGFWGYRHSLGLPLTLDGTQKNMPPVITFKDDLKMVAGVSMDPLFVERDPHLNRLKVLKSSLKMERDESYAAIVNRLRNTTPHLLYFYCHGGIRANNNRPYLEVGVEDRFGPESLVAQKIKFTETNPLVFINGCHTTSLNPEISLNFVSAFVQQSGAAGVIGTEITIFEPLAAKFAEECFGRFVGAPPHNQSMPIGPAVRGARLELLRQGNPLGLVYIPYAVATLRLEKSEQN